MLSTVLTHPLFLASAISFFLGSFGYILVRLWLRPVMRYGRAKRRVKIVLKQIDMAYSGGKPFSELSENMRRHADTLTSVYHEDLPYWYRLLLQKREEDPIRAATLLMKLANTHTPDHARQQAEEIKASLKLT
jgi:hypothetical protein